MIWSTNLLHNIVALPSRNYNHKIIKCALIWVDINLNFSHANIWKFMIWHPRYIIVTYHWFCVISMWHRSHIRTWEALRDINSFWPSDVIWPQRLGQILAHVMACCLTAPSYYLNQCWLIITGILWHSLESNIWKSAHERHLALCLEFILIWLLPYLPGANELILIYGYSHIQG